MGHRQKGKGHKRKRSWHRLRNQDAKWQRAMRRLNRATDAAGHLSRANGADVGADGVEDVLGREKGDLG